jgi:hypothetical protein
MKNILKVVTLIGKKKHTNEGTKALFEVRKPDLFFNFGKFPCPWIRIRIPNTDADPGQIKADPCGSTTLVISIVRRGKMRNLLRKRGVLPPVM